MVIQGVSFNVIEVGKIVKKFFSFQSSTNLK